MHTENDPIGLDKISMDVNFTDYYQYCMISLIMFVSLPIMFFLIMGYFRDPRRYVMIPCMITSLVFGSFAVLLSLLSIINTILNGRSIFVRLAQGANIFVYFYTLFFNCIYHFKYAKKDLLVNEEGELDF